MQYNKNLYRCHTAATILGFNLQDLRNAENDLGEAPSEEAVQELVALSESCLKYAHRLQQDLGFS